MGTDLLERIHPVVHPDPRIVVLARDDVVRNVVACLDHLLGADGATDETLAGIDRALRVERHLLQRGVAHDGVLAVAERHHRRMGAVALRV